MTYLSDPRWICFVHPVSMVVTASFPANGPSTSITNDIEYHIDDMDFSHYNNDQLAYLCDHRVFVRSRFPKLVFSLVHHPRFVEWIQSTPDVTCTSEVDKVACVVEAVRVYATDARGKVAHTTIRLDDATFWQVLVEQCWKHKPQSETKGDTVKGKRQDAAVSDHERRVLHRVHRTLKPYRYWKTPEDKSGAERSSEMNKHGASSNTTRKKTRSIWIA